MHSKSSNFRFRHSSCKIKEISLFYSLLRSHLVLTPTQGYSQTASVGRARPPAVTPAQTPAVLCETVARTRCRSSGAGRGSLTAAALSPAAGAGASTPWSARRRSAGGIDYKNVKLN